MRVLNVYQLMWGIERYVVSGAVAGLRAVVWHDDGAALPGLARGNAGARRGAAPCDRRALSATPA